MLLMIDNYDSFTYNLVQYLAELGAVQRVLRNDQINLDGIQRLAPTHILISPGPGRPEDGGISLDLIKTFGGQIPILGVCLGHQCISQVYGAKVVRAPRLMHGKTSPVEHDGKGVLAGLPSPFRATRYHSLIVEPGSVPDCLEVTSRTAEGEIMGVRHKEYTVEGIQFHPESILTEHGHALLKNFIQQTGGKR